MSVTPAYPGSPRQRLRESLWARGNVLWYPGAPRPQPNFGEVSERSHRAMTPNERRRTPQASVKRGRFVLDDPAIDTPVAHPHPVELRPGKTRLDALRTFHPRDPPPPIPRPPPVFDRLSTPRAVTPRAATLRETRAATPRAHPSTARSALADDPCGFSVAPGLSQMSLGSPCRASVPASSLSLGAWPSRGGPSGICDRPGATEKPQGSSAHRATSATADRQLRTDVWVNNAGVEPVTVYGLGTTVYGATAAVCELRPRMWARLAPGSGSLRCRAVPPRAASLVFYLSDAAENLPGASSGSAGGGALGAALAGAPPVVEVLNTARAVVRLLHGEGGALKRGERRAIPLEGACALGGDTGGGLSVVAGGLPWAPQESVSAIWSAGDGTLSLKLVHSSEPEGRRHAVRQRLVSITCAA